MFSSINPVCSITQQPAIMFCFAQNCTKPAFACQQAQIINHKHGFSGRCYFWQQISSTIYNILQKGLLPTDITTLQRQQKQMQILIQDLQKLLENHRNNLLRCRQQLKLKDDVERILETFRTGTTSLILGKDMAKLMKAIESDDITDNKQRVEQVISEDNKIVDQLLQQIKLLVKEYNQPKFDSSKGQRKITPVIDLENSKMAVVDNGIITIKTNQKTLFYSVFTKKPLLQGQSFQVQVISHGANTTVGVAPATRRNTANKEWFKLCLHFCCHYEDKMTNIKFGDRVTVKRSAVQIQWLQNDKPLHTIPIPNELINVELFPVLQFYSYDTPQNIGKLRFI